MILSAEEFVKLRLSSDSVQYNHASQEEASEQVWFEIIDKFPDLRAWVVHNKTVPISILDFLSNDLDPEIRAVVADKRKLTPELRYKLALDKDSSVRARIAYNAKCEYEILLLLANDVEFHVREAALSRLNLK